MTTCRNVAQWLQNRKEIFGYIIVLLIISIPLYNTFLFRGHDIYFHLMRIEGLTEGLKAGQFPIKIQPEWFGGYGYAVSVFYGDLLLFPIAFFRMLGMSLQNAYKSYVFLCNVGTIIIAGYSFTRIFANRVIGLIGSALYCFSIYRLMNVYVRASLGEYTGMMLLPLVAYACVLLFSQDKKQLRKSAYILGISMAVIVQSHILTCEILCIVLALVLVFNIRNIWNKEIIISGLKAVCIAIGLSIGFLVPFVDYMLNMNLQINSGGSSTSAYIQRQGAFWKQHVEVFNSTQGASLDISAGTVGEFSIGIGLTLTLAIMAFLVTVIFVRKKESKFEWKIALIAAILGSITIWMTTYRFPWNRLAEYAGPFKSIISSIQFPWRFSSVATLCMVILWCSVIKILWNDKRKWLLTVAGAVITALTLTTIIFFYIDLYTYRERIHVKTAIDMDTFVWSGNEYLPISVNLEEIKQRTLFENDNLKIDNYLQKGTNLSFSCENPTGIEQELKVPLLYYKGYQATGICSDGEKRDIAVCAADNGVVQLTIPRESSLNVQIKFVQPVLWRVAEVISALVFIGIVFQSIYICKKKRYVVS